MNITLFGAGYVGLVTAACLAELDHRVICVDVDTTRIESLKQGIIPIFEPGLSELISKNVTQGRLRFTTDAKEGVAHGQIQFIAVNTPAKENGSADIRHVLAVAHTIASHMQDYRLIINKSTAPVGTVAKIKAEVNTILQQRGQRYDFDVASNPEFLKEGAAVSDFMNPDRIILGLDNPRAESRLSELYARFTDRLIWMDSVSAELTKYAANAMLAAKISFINEMAHIAETVGADINAVRQGIAADPRIGGHFIAPGCGYGGSCFPKDVKALIYSAQAHQIDPWLLKAIDRVNVQQKQRLFHKITQHFGNDLQGINLAIWGLSFKPNTNDIREAASLTLLNALLQTRVNIKAYDPVAMPEVRALYPNEPKLKFCPQKEACLSDADALVICTEWDEFSQMALSEIKAHLRQPVIFDGRNIFDLRKAQALGFIYYGIGRGEKTHRSRLRRVRSTRSKDKQVGD